MEQHSNFPITNRESFRRSLQNSLTDVLGYLGATTSDLDTRPGCSPFDIPTVPSHMLVRSPAGAASVSSTLLTQTLGLNEGTPPLRRLLDSQVNHEATLLRHAEKRLFQVQTAALLERMAMEKRQESLRDALLLQLLQAHRVSGPPVRHLEDAGQKMSFPHDTLVATAQGPTMRTVCIGDQVRAQKRKQNAFTLHALGNNLRNRNDPFIDCLDIEDPNEESLTKASSHRRSRGGVSSHFPERLHQMLLDVEDDNKTEVVSFLPHGRAFCVHDMDRFVSEIMPKYFKQSKWNSFARQLNLYGFIRLANGPDAGGYYHEL